MPDTQRATLLGTIVIDAASQVPNATLTHISMSLAGRFRRLGIAKLAATAGVIRVQVCGNGNPDTDSLPALTPTWLDVFPNGGVTFVSLAAATAGMIVMDMPAGGAIRVRSDTNAAAPESIALWGIQPTGF